MKKSVKLALKRFVILLIVLVMVLSLFMTGTIDNTARIIIGILFGVVVIIYWVYAIIVIRRENQRKNKDKNEK